MGKGRGDLLAGVRWNHMDDLKRWVSARYGWVSAGYRRVAAICGRAAAIYKRWKRWLDPVVGIFAVFYTGWFVWQEVQGFTPSYLAAVVYFFVVFFFIMSVVSPYLKELFVAVLGMFVGAIAGIVPYIVVGILLLLLSLSSEGQASYEALNQLFNNAAFRQLFFVAGAASGGPVAVYVYFEKRKEKAAESGKAG